MRRNQRIGNSPEYYIHRMTNMREEQHAADLQRGLSLMQANFAAEICDLCDGQGRRKQNYTAGCGMGSYRSYGPCDYCKGSGLLQCNVPAPFSVINQVLVAAGVP